MTRRSQLRLIFHGAVFIVISTMMEAYPGLLITFHNVMSDQVRQYWRQGHSIMMVTGIYMIATSMALPLLELTSRGISWIVWSFVVTVYSFIGATAAIFLGFYLHPPDPSCTQYPPDPSCTQWQQTMAIGFPLNWANIILVGITGAASFIPGVLILRGAYMAMRYSPIDEIH
jgi:hypothetical protein